MRGFYVRLVIVVGLFVSVAWADDPHTNARNTARDLGQMCALYPQMCTSISLLSVTCINWAERTPDANRYRHLCWACTLTTMWGADRARAITGIHEGNAPPGEQSDSLIDIQNNFVGTRLGEALVRENGGWLYSNEAAASWYCTRRILRQFPIGGN